MSLKENVDYIKKELSAEESFLENSIKTERFFKKYKNIIIGAVAIFVLGGIGYSVNDYMGEQNRLEANGVFNKVQQNPTDTTALNELKQKDGKLHEIALFMKDNKESTNLDYLKELSLYANAVEKNNITEITTASQNQKLLLKEFALFNKALLETKESKYKDAKTTLKLIPDTSDIAGLKKMLEHFLVTK